jgi:ribonuclease HI
LRRSARGRLVYSCAFGHSGRMASGPVGGCYLTAICEALETLTGAIEVKTDSAYVEKCFDQNWHERWLRDGAWKGSNARPVKNRDLWERLFGLVGDGRRDVPFKWIKGHADEPNNHRVDRLARAAALSAG